ncbi:hypothetical protein C8J57DRAFT_1652277 [Mycena rebaudengoi]|nr:hypothetical protein C8J57DRAFT_1652277 [Mycena rebaudengoi]
MELSPESLHSPYHPQNLPQNASYEQTARLYWQSLQVPAQEHSSCSDSLNSREKHAPTDPSTYYYTPNSAFSSNASETVLESVNPAETYNSSNSLLSDGHQISYTPTDGVHALSNGPPDSAVSDYHRSLALHHAHHAHVIPSMLAPDYYQPSPHSTYSATPSTPSDFYDEDAENINPNQMPYPTHAPRPMNVLRDSQAYPVPQDDDENGIAAPVPLPYNARSKSVLSAMISPVEHTRTYRSSLTIAFRGPVGRSSDLGRSRWTPVDSLDVDVLTGARASQPRPSLAPTTPSYTLNFSYAPELAHYTLTPPRSRIRPITPSTLLALTEPFLMAWCADYRHALIPPPLSSNAAVAAGPVGLMGPGVSTPTWGQPHPSLTGLIQAGGAYFRS